MDTTKNYQSLNATIANLIAEAKTLLQDAKQIALDNDMEYVLEGLVTDMMDDISNNQMWYGSDQSLC